MELINMNQTNQQKMNTRMWKKTILFAPVAATPTTPAAVSRVKRKQFKSMQLSEFLYFIQYFTFIYISSFINTVWDLSLKEWTRPIRSDYTHRAWSHDSNTIKYMLQISWRSSHISQHVQTDSDSSSGPATFYSSSQAQYRVNTITQVTKTDFCKLEEDPEAAPIDTCTLPLTHSGAEMSACINLSYVVISTSKRLKPSPHHSGFTSSWFVLAWLLFASSCTEQRFC